MAFKSFRLIKRKVISKEHKRATIIQIFNDISDKIVYFKRNKQKKDNFISIQLKKIDILVETST